MIYRVHHATRYNYASPVDLGAHMLHLQPRSLPGQRVLRSAVMARPAPARQQQGTDHFGNRVTWLFLESSHPDFEVVAESQVEVNFPPLPPIDSTMPWEAVVRHARQAPDAAEFLFPSPMLPHSADAAAYAAPSFPPHRPVLAGLLALNARIRQDFVFRVGVTDIATPIQQVLARREGVCQDFTNLMIAGLRGLGLPARYVSGYIRTRPPPGQPRRQGADQSHAWVGCWLGPGYGWADLDPTNALVVQDEHVVLGWGRDYGDISPIRGVLLGGGAHSLTVSVDLEPAGDRPAE